jgi:hypothetical protein
MGIYISLAIIVRATTADGALEVEAVAVTEDEE